MQGLIGFNQHKIKCIIGVHSNEHHSEQEIFIDLKVKTNFKRCVQTDALADTIDYVAMAEVCTLLAKSHHYHLLETYAWEVLHKLFERFPIEWAWIRIQKPAALASGYAYVELERKI